MMRALYSSVAGLKTHQTKMDVIGNNIANVNTVGFKSSRVTFSTMMYQTLSSASGANDAMGTGGLNAKQIGLGANFASTAVDIETGGASETTGKAFDLKLSDANTTSFYIVNTGTENVFTRAGAFYVDGAGNLCMESTGYMVMGWQVDANGNINKDTVSPLKIMSADNQTSQPEFTTQAVCNGILDDNSATVNTDTGYTMNLNFFDNLGYSYTGRFAFQKTGDKDSGEYTVNLTDIIDSNGQSIISGTSVLLGDLFGGMGQGSNVDVTNNYTMASGMSNALKGLATRTDPNNNNQLTYYFSADYINETYGNKTDRLPDGSTVQYTVSVDSSTNPPTYTAVSLNIVDKSGLPVAEDTYDQWFSDTGNAANGPTLEKTVLATDQAADWYDRNVLRVVTDDDGNKHYLLKKDQLTTLSKDYPDAFQSGGGGGGTTTSIAPDNLNIELQVDESTNPPTYTFAEYPASTGGTGSDSATVATALNTASNVTTLNDYLSYGYLLVDAKEVNSTGIYTTDLPEDLEVRYSDSGIKLVTPSSDGFTVKFSTSDGTLEWIGQEGNTSQILNLGLYRDEGNPFSNIEIDFSSLKNLSNGGTSTAAMASGANGGSDGKGKKVGTMIGLSVDTSGKIFGTYSNGNTALLGQIAVARFSNASGLESIGDNCYRTTMNSGEFDGIGVEIDSDGSSIDSGVLEMSNVDLATEFTMMITTQRGYQANSRVISTTDSILEELVNLKR